jgi:L-threonylcarbamoyladenylate synthase
MHARHYSPRTSLFLVSNGNVPEQGQGIYLQLKAPPNRSIIIRQMPLSAPDYAAALYRELHQADESNPPWIAADLPPTTTEWEAIHDRLRRASSRV